RRASERLLRQLACGVVDAHAGLEVAAEGELAAGGEHVDRRVDVDRVAQRRQAAGGEGEQVAIERERRAGSRRGLAVGLENFRRGELEQRSAAVGGVFDRYRSIGALAGDEAGVEGELPLRAEAVAARRGKHDVFLEALL